MSFSLAPHPIGIKWWTSLWRANKDLSFSQFTAKLTDSVYHFTHRNLGKYFYAHRSGPLGMKAAVVVLFAGVKLGSGIYGTRRDELAKKAMHKAASMNREACLLIPYCQNYEWGKIGSDSRVAQLAHSGNSIDVEESKPYAELWMGSHLNGPCFVKTSDDAPLIEISEYLEKTSSGSIEFLFKVLSVRKALSIQSHPDAELARELHAKFPSIYKDPNPKPELAIAMTPFRALFGFRPLDEIVSFMRLVPALAEIAGVEKFQDLIDASQSHEPQRRKNALRAAYSELMQSSEERVKKCIDAVLSVSGANNAFALARDLNIQFPGDVGVLSVFFLNIVDLLPGQAIYMGPNVPHAYISGDLIECMTCSDNVIRGGLTPKFKDVDTLVSSLDYTALAPRLLYPETCSARGITTWSPGNVPFAVTEYLLKRQESCEMHPRTKGPSIALVTRGSGRIDSLSVKEGQCVLLPPSASSKIQAGEEGVQIFHALTPNIF